MSDSQKIAEQISKLDGSKPFVSIEFFPPKTAAGVTSLHKTLEAYKKYDVLFADFTWGAGGSTSDLTLELCQETKSRHDLNPNMHLTCTNMPIEKVDHALATCKETGITNILALRGDPPAGEEVWTATEGGLTCALDLVKYIRDKHGDYFSITVAGYPEGHPTAMTVWEGDISELTPAEQGRCSIDIQEDGTKVVHVCRDDAFLSEIAYLKEKVAAGTNLIITQMFFDVEVFKSFVNICREAGINVPIIPGIMPVANYGGFKRMIKFCKTRVSQSILDAVETFKEDAEGMKQFGIEFGTKMCQDLMDFGVAGLHFYTLNTAGTTVSIMEKLGYTPKPVPAVVDNKTEDVVAEAEVSEPIAVTA